LNTKGSKYISNKQQVWTAAVQKRIGLTASMLGSMKSVKMMGLSRTMSTSIQEQRIRELKSAKGYRWLVVGTNMIGMFYDCVAYCEKLVILAAYTPNVFAPVLTFVIYAIQAKISGSNTLSTNQAFTSLAIITSMTGPAAMLAASIPESAACLGCFERIQKFLAAPSWKDSRTSADQPRRRENRVSSSNGGRDIELRHVQADQSQSIAHATVSPEAHAESAIIITNLTARPSLVSEPALVKVDIRLRFSTINVLTGPIGSGKSTLLRAILGELPLDAGSIFVSSNNMAYCAQTPWILNIPIQKSVSGLTRGQAIKEEWYSKVMHACALDKDMLQLADGDQSIPGSRGLNLSGGQKQRVVSAMACTTYTFCGSDDLTIL
jgi:ATP-binding cassette, subfamily C (CFTR/MRP), member 1